MSLYFEAEKIIEGFPNLDVDEEVGQVAPDLQVLT